MKRKASLLFGLILLATLISIDSQETPNPLSISPPPPEVDRGRLPFPLKKEGRFIDKGVHRYYVPLGQGEVVDAVVEQVDVDVVVNLCDPHGELLFSVDNPNGKNGSEDIFLLAEISGDYVIEVESPSKGSYRIRGREIRRADSRDRNHAKAEKAFHRARAIREGKPLEALEGFKEASGLWERNKDLPRRALTFELMGDVLSYGVVGEWEKSLLYSRQARDLYRVLEDRKSQARMFNSEGFVLKKLGLLKEAEHAYSQAIELGEGALVESATAFHGRGVLRWLRGDLVGALDDLEESFSFWSQAGSHPEQQANTLDNLLHLHAQFGNYNVALDRVGSIVLGLLSDESRAKLFTRLGEVYRGKGDLDTAESYAGKALRLRLRTEGLKGAVAKTLVELSLIHREKGQLGTARAELDEALLIFRSVSDAGSEAATLVNLGLVLYDQRDLRQSKEALEHALRIARDRESPAIEAAALYTLALLEYRQGNHEIAKRTAREALELIDSDEQRRLINQAEESYLAARNGIYDLLMEISIARPVEQTSRQDLLQAFEISEGGRRRRLLEGVSGLQQRFDALDEDSSGLQEERLRLESVLGDLWNEEQRLGGDKKSTSVKVKEVLEELATIDARIQINHPWYSMAKRPTPVVLEEALDLLDDDAALIVYELMTDRSIAFVLTKNSQEIYELPPVAELKEEVEKFFVSISRRPDSRRHRRQADIAKKLSKALMPFYDKLDSSRLIIIPDGVLQKVPFAALPDPEGGGFLFQRHKVSLLPSVSVLRAIRQIVANRKVPDGALAMFSVSDFPQGGWEPLSHSREEAEGIRDLVGKTEVPPFVAFDGMANKEAVTSGRLKGFRIIHFATHASNHPKQPELSRIILYDGDLTVREIQNLDLRAELVVLSACETAQGVEVVGEGQVGLAHAFIYAGAARVVASLWKVDDEATSQFMQRFYYEMSEERGAPAPAEALRATQKWMSGQARWRSPYYWAGFQLIGEWR